MLENMPDHPCPLSPSPCKKMIEAVCLVVGFKITDMMRALTFGLFVSNLLFDDALTAEDELLFNLLLLLLFSVSSIASTVDFSFIFFLVVFKFFRFFNQLMTLAQFLFY